MNRGGGSQIVLRETARTNFHVSPPRVPYDISQSEENSIISSAIGLARNTESSLGVVERALFANLEHSPRQILHWLTRLRASGNYDNI